MKRTEGSGMKAQIGLMCLAAICWMLGCAPHSTTVPVSGRVSVDGKPLIHGSILFEDRRTKESFVSPVENGVFEFVSNGELGLPMGNYGVGINSTAPNNPGSVVPEKYRLPQTSELTCSITDVDEFQQDFELTSD